MSQEESITLFKNHSGTIGFWMGTVIEPDQLVITHAKSLDGKPVTHHYTIQGKNIGKVNETTPFDQAMLELNSRARKQQDKGYVETPEQAKEPATNGLGLLKPMLATPFEKVKPEKIEWYNAFAQPKLDGHRALYKDGVLYSRQGKPIDLPHINEAIEAAGLAHLHLDGELYIHGKTLQQISSLVKKEHPETPDLEYHIYDHIAHKPFSHRFQEFLVSNNFLSNNSIAVVPTHEVSFEEELMELHTQWLEEEYEGTILRFGTNGYETDKRSAQMLKLKEFHDAEYTIVDVKMGTPYVREEGTYQNPIYVMDSGNGGQFTVTAPGNMYEKHELSRLGKSVVGMDLTVKYHYLSKDGIPQLPVALRFREEL